MRAFAAFIMRGRTQAITVSALCAAMSLILPPLSYVSGAVIGLATLKQGPTQGAYVAVGSMLLAAMFTLFAVGTPYPVLVFAGVTWVPVWVLAVVLRSTASPGAALVAGGALGAMAVTAVHLLVPDPASWWREILDRVVMGTFSGNDVPMDPDTAARLEGFLDELAPLMTGLVAAGTVFGLILTLFLARWWHALIDNPGGFGGEFRELRLDRRVAVAALVIGLTALFANQATGGLGADYLWIVLLLYTFQGLAVAHGIVSRRKASIGWLVGLYVLLSFPWTSAPAFLFLALMGLSDTWMDFRARSGGMA